MPAKSRTTKRFRQTAVAAMQGLGHLLWPGVCMNCQEKIPAGGNGLCGDCWENLISLCGPDYCRRCGRDASPYAVSDGVCPNCRGEQIHFDAIARAGVYAGPLQKMVLSFKGGQTELDFVLGGLICSAIQASSFLNDIELFVPVPLHWIKRFLRGYNQSNVLAKRLKPPFAKISADLVRIRYTKAQPTMPTAVARKKNVAGAFAVRHRHPFAGRRICLIDDIKTTGATLNECAKTLKEAGASKVFALVLAVAGQNTR